jgi:hypothetical protein
MVLLNIRIAVADIRAHLPAQTGLTDVKYAQPRADLEDGQKSRRVIVLCRHACPSAAEAFKFIAYISDPNQGRVLSPTQ